MRPTAIVAMALLEFGCAGPGSIDVVQSEYWKNENFAKYENYAWLPSDAHQRAATQAEDHRLHDWIREAIDRRLAAKGFARAQSGDAHFLVTYHCRITEKLEAAVIDRVWYGTGDQARWEEVTRRVELTTFDEGSIVIDFVEPGADHRVWRGIALGRISREATPEQLQRIVDRSIREILDEFPARRRESQSNSAVGVEAR